MTPETLTALKASIAKWDANAVVRRRADAKLRHVDCPLCALFANDRIAWIEKCVGCPVLVRTGKQNCRGTPFYDAYYAKRNGPLSEFSRTARAEAAFLRSLLPEEETA